MSLKPDEDSRNGFLATILKSKGIMVFEQARWGSSSTGKIAGRIDLKIEKPDGSVEAIIEAFNLSHLDRLVIASHATKVFHYDLNGLPRNFIIVYSSAKDFVLLWRKYLEFIVEPEYRYPIIGRPEEKTTDYSGIKQAVTSHHRDGEIVELVHLFIDMSSRT